MRFITLPLISLSAIVASTGIAVNASNLMVEQEKASSDPNKPTCSVLYPGAKYWIETRMQNGQTVSSTQYTIQTESKFCRIQGVKR